MWFKKNLNKFINFIKNLIFEEKDFYTLFTLFCGGYFFIYLLFAGEGWILPGVDLHKRDWLAFLGSYLSFVGTLFVYYITLLQNKTFMEEAEKQKSKDRFDQIQPILSVEVKTQNKKRIGSTEDLEKDKALVLKEFTFIIKNLGSFPALHVCVFGKYVLPSLAVGDSFKFTCGYDIKTTVRTSPVDFIFKLSPDSNAARPPENLYIEYNDVDGCSMVQWFQRREYLNAEMYTLLKKDRNFNICCNIRAGR